MKQVSRTISNTTLYLTIILLLFSANAWAGKKTKVVKTKGIQQIMLIKFKDSTSDKAIENIAVRAYEMTKRARTLKSVEWGKKTQVADDTKAYDYCLILHFKSETDFEIYHQNPVRLEFMGKLIPLASDILKFTYQGSKTK